MMPPSSEAMLMSLPLRGARRCSFPVNCPRNALDPGVARSPATKASTPRSIVEPLFTRSSAVGSCGAVKPALKSVPASRRISPPLPALLKSAPRTVSTAPVSSERLRPASSAIFPPVPPEALIVPRTVRSPWSAATVKLRATFAVPPTFSITTLPVRTRRFLSSKKPPSLSAPLTSVKDGSAPTSSRNRPAVRPAPAPPRRVAPLIRNSPTVAATVTAPASPPAAWAAAEILLPASNSTSPASAVSVIVPASE